MKRIVCFAASVLILSSVPCLGTIINIPLDYPNIQYGINASADGDTVLVQPGTYVENINFNGHNIVLGSLYLTTGDTSHISTTIIDGDSAGSVVRFDYGNDTTAVIAGFTIQNGSYGNGGGINCKSGTIRNNVIKQNYANTYGGGIHCEGGPIVIIRHNIIKDNLSSISGGGICLYSSGRVVLENNTIKDNTTPGNGGGIYHISGGPINISGNSITGNYSGWIGGGICTDGFTTIINNNINDNYSTRYGGGIYCGGTDVVRYNTISDNYSADMGGGIACPSYVSPEIENNLINGNASGTSGGGVACWYNSSPQIRNNTLSLNSANISGGGIYCGSNLSPIVTNTIFWSNSANTGNEIFINSGTPEFSYCNIQDTLWPGPGNISIDPLFRNPGNNDYHLMSTACGDSADSPCIDAGSIYSADTLLDCSWGLGTFAADMGAYGGGDSTTGNNVVINVPGDYPGIQLAIDACVDGDTVLVQPDIYYENINFNGRNIVVGSMFIMTGDESYISSTIIDGSDSASVIIFDSGEDNTAYLIGFTIRNGWANHGGGIYCYNSDPVISNNVITGNSVISFGGGVLFLESSSAFSNNILTGNSANRGGGICCMGSSPTIVNNVLTGNTGNTSGGGIYCTLDSDPVIINTICWEDSAATGIEIDHDNTSSPLAAYCDIQGGWTGIGNIDADPLFRDPDNGDFHLMAVACSGSVDSPCIDAGDPNISDTLLDCSWGLGGLRSDMGAYGGGDLPITDIFDDYIPAPRELALDQNYPNPFNAQTSIEFDLDEPQFVRITVFDLLGRRVQTLLDEYRQAGTHTITFDGSGLSSGVYFYSLQASEAVKTKRMLLLK